MATREYELVCFIEGAGAKGVTSAELAAWLATSVRTMRDRVRRANSSLKGARISSGSAGGYRLVIDDPSAFVAWKSNHESTRDSLPQTPTERVSYLLNDLLSRADWITLEELADILCVSRASVSGDIRVVEKNLMRFGLKLERRPHYGIRVNGSEASRRICLAHMAMLGEGISRPKGAFAMDDQLPLISGCVDGVLEAANLQINSIAYQNLLVHIAVALERMRSGCYVPVDDELMDEVSGTREYEAASFIADAITKTFGANLPEGEVAYIAIHLASKITADGDANGKDDLVISDEVWSVVSEMLDLIWRVYRFDFRGDFELRMNLARHIVPLAVRLRWHMNLENPILGDTRKRFPLAYSMASDASSVLSEKYGAKLTDDEVGYIALAFALAMERQRAEAPRKRVLIVCASGVGSARLLEHRIKTEFSSQIEKIITCSLGQVRGFDFSTVDYVFTTVPLREHIPVPVREIKFFLDDTDVRGMRDLLSRDTACTASAMGYFARDLFFPHLDMGSREEVLEFLCGQVMARRALPGSYRELVFKREGMAPTAFGGIAAMPHPMEALGDETFACVGLLDRPVEWVGSQVRVVFLLSVSREERELDSFYEALLDVMMDEMALAKLLDSMSFETLRDIVECN